MVVGSRRKSQRTLPSGRQMGRGSPSSGASRTTLRPSSPPGDGSGSTSERQPRGFNSNEPGLADGRLVLFSRGRFARPTRDIYAAGRRIRGRALTHPFPSGGTNSTPQWLTGPRVTGHEPSPRTIAFPFKRRLVFKPRSSASSPTDAARILPPPRMPGCRSGTRRSGEACAAPSPARTRVAPEMSVGRRSDRMDLSSREHVLASRLQTFRSDGTRSHRRVFVREREGGGTVGDPVGRGTTIAFTNHHEGASMPATPGCCRRQGARARRRSTVCAPFAGG